MARRRTPSANACLSSGDHFGWAMCFLMPSRVPRRGRHAPRGGRCMGCVCPRVRRCHGHASVPHAPRLGVGTTTHALWWRAVSGVRRAIQGRGMSPAEHLFGRPNRGGAISTKIEVHLFLLRFIQSRRRRVYTVPHDEPRYSNYIRQLP